MNILLIALAAHTTASASPELDALSSWFSDTCSSSTSSVITYIEPITLSRSVKEPTLAMAIQLSSTELYLEGHSTSIEQLSDELQERVDQARMLEQMSIDQSFRFNARLLLILAADAPGDVLVQILEMASRMGFVAVEFYFSTDQVISAPELLNPADVEALLAELAPLGPAERQQQMIARLTPLISACPALESVFETLSFASVHQRCEVMTNGFPPVLKACNDPALSRELYMLLSQMARPMDQAPGTTVTLTLQPDGMPLQVAEGDTWQTLHQQVLSRDGGTLSVGSQ